MVDKDLVIRFVLIKFFKFIVFLVDIYKMRLFFFVVSVYVCCVMIYIYEDI